MCTFLTFADAKGNAYKGRTMELSDDDGEYLVYYPVGSHFQSENPKGEVTFDFKTRYPIVCLELINIQGHDYSPMFDGANNQGLTLSVNAMPGSRRSSVPEDQMQKAMSIVEFGHYVLGNLTTVDEVRDLLQNKVFFYVPKMYEGVLKLHYAFMDKSGKSIVFEYLDDGIQIYDNPVGVMTNGPEFSWHLKNLNNYAHLTNLNKNNGQFGDLKVTTPDAGVAMSNVPSTQISWGRFVKAAFFKTFVDKGATPDAHVVNLAHVMNNFDRPAGLTKDSDSDRSSNDAEGAGESEFTEWTILFDASRSKLWFRAINQLNYVEIDINEVARSSKMQSISYKDFNGFSV